MSNEVSEQTKPLSESDSQSELESPNEAEYQPDFSFLGMIKSFSVLTFIMLFPIMAITVMFPILIETPLSWYMSTDVTHTVSSFSYKPGATATEYSYYYQLNDGSYEKLNIIIMFVLPAMFYTGVLVVLANIRAFWKALVSPKQSEKKPLKLRFAPLLFIVFASIPFFVFQTPFVRALIF